MGISFRFDGLKNLFTGRGVKNDPELGERPGNVMTMMDQQYLQLFRGTGLARAIVKRPVDRCTRPGFVVKGDKAEEVEEKLKDVEFQKMARKLMYWDQVFGGGVMVIGATGSGVLADPLVGDRINDLEFLRVYRREEVDKTTGISRDPNSKRFGKPEYYRISPSNGSPYDVHWTKIVELDGEPVDDITYIENSYWGDSIYPSTFDAVQRAENALDSASRSIKDFSNYVIEIDGLFEAISEGKQDKILERLRLLQITRDSMNIVVHDKDETVSKITTNLSGIKDVVQEQLGGLTATTGIPGRILLGSQQGGLNNKGDGETGDWREYLEDLRNDKYVPILDMCFKVACYAVGADIENHSYELGEIDKPSQKEQAETYKTLAEADKIYNERKILHREEIRETRFAEDGKISTTTKTMDDYDDIELDEEALFGKNNPNGGE